MTRRQVMLATALALAAAPRQARAFPTGSQFDMDALDEDGAGGVAFTGAPRWAGHTCAVCHTGAAEQIGLRLDADDVALFSGGYRPGKVYHLRVALVDDWVSSEMAAAGDDCGDNVMPYRRCDDNGFALEIDDGDGEPVGRLSPIDSGGGCGGTVPIDADVRVLDDGGAVTQSGAHDGVRAWELCWKAPAKDTGPVTVYLSGVDGGGGDGTADNPNDAEGDDVAAGAVPLIEHGAGRPPGGFGGCAVDAGARGELGWTALLVAAAALLATRRRRLAAALLGLALWSGCATVKPWQKDKLAQTKMTFAADPAEDELDLHMQESREGSRGGYGSSGGGCGCN